jgi:hypothetical protein
LKPCALRAIFSPFVLFMGYAIMRWGKLKTERQASQATGHNYRQRPTLNADEERQALNKEYVNTAKRPYWDLLNERIQGAGVKRVRSDSVKGMEVILTGSPEKFTRGANGKETDFSNTDWVRANLAFLQETFGKENVVAFTLHQDETTPHIHAVICPIYEHEGAARLSADKLFNPDTLREYQTAYAAKMAPFGMERGVMHSQAKHQAMKRLYGQAEHAAQLVPGPVLVEAVKLGKIPPFGHGKWKEDEATRLNEAFAQQVGQVQERVNKAVQQAQASASAPEQVKTLRKQLATSEGLKQAHFDQLQAKQAELTRLAIGVVQQDLAPGQALADYGTKAREEVKTALTGHIEQILKGKVSDRAQFITQLTAQGYQYRRAGQVTEFFHELTGARFAPQVIQPNGQAIEAQLVATIERTQRQAQEQTKRPSQGQKLK